MICAGVRPLLARSARMFFFHHKLQITFGEKRWATSMLSKFSTLIWVILNVLIEGVWLHLLLSCKCCLRWCIGSIVIQNHSSTALAIASFTAWFVRLFLVGGTDTATVDVFAATDVDEVEVSFCFGASPLAARLAEWQWHLLGLPLSRSMLSLVIDFRFFRRRPRFLSAAFFESGLK